jgi:hypothetical protein
MSPTLQAIPVFRDKLLGVKKLDWLFVERRMETKRNLKEDVERKKTLYRDKKDVRTVFIVYHELEIGKMDF